MKLVFDLTFDTSAILQHSRTTCNQ